MPPPKTYAVEVKLAPKNAEKIHSRVFVASDPEAVLKSVYLSRPHSDQYKHAKITVEFLD